MLTNYKVLGHWTETGMRICRSQYLQDKLGQKINKQGVLIREGVGKINKLKMVTPVSYILMNLLKYSSAVKNS